MTGEDTATATARVGSSLWRTPGYPAYLVSQAVGQTGFQVSVVALPLTAVVVLGASPAQLGLLVAAERLPFVLFALLAGLLVDRWSRRQLLIATAVLRAPLVLTVPIAAAMGCLTVEQLYLVGFSLGTMTVLADLAALSFMPSLVPRGLLPAANANLEAVRSGSEVVGPSLGGALIVLITAPYALVVDALSFLVSGAVLVAVRKDEGQKAGTVADSQGAWQGIKEGLVFVRRSPVLRWNAVVSAAANLFVYAFLTIQFPFVIDDLRLDAALLGVLVSLGGVGGVLGSLAAGRIADRLGIGAGFLVGSATMATGVLLVGVVPAGVGVGLAMAGSGYLLFVCGAAIFSVAAVTIRQAVTPAALLGRTNATMRFLVYCTIPLGALIGGLAAEVAGSRAVVILSGVGLLVPTALLAASPIRDMRLADT